jgi:ADP-ribose pyrophosphatase YjhB (NUDIX family)
MTCGAPLRTVRERGRRRRRCARCGFTFYDNPVLATMAIVARGGRVLLTRRAHAPYAGLWDLPGGFVEAGETAEGGMRRELREELGVGVRRLRLLGLEPDTYGPGGFPTMTVIYRVTLRPGAIDCADDVTEARWFPEGELPFRSIAFVSTRRALRTYVRVSCRRR